MDLCGEPRWGRAQWVCSLQGQKRVGSSPDPPSLRKLTNKRPSLTSLLRHWGSRKTTARPSHTFNRGGKPLPTQGRSPLMGAASGCSPSSNVSWLLVLTRP